MAKYGFGPLTAFAGYEHILYSNPSTILPNGYSDIGGYLVGTFTSNADTTNQVVQIAWTGAKCAVTPSLSVTGAYYHYAQNSYAGSGCGDSAKSSRSGTENVGSIMGDDKVTKRFDVYGGAMYSHVLNGMDSGYLHSDNLSPMVGGRFNF